MLLLIEFRHNIPSLAHLIPEPFDFIETFFNEIFLSSLISRLREEVILFSLNQSTSCIRNVMHTTHS